MRVTDQLLRQTLKEWIDPDTSLLELGCGSGDLLNWMSTQMRLAGYGMEIDSDCIHSCLGKGLNVIEHDIDTGLQLLQDKSFDTVLMKNGLHQLSSPDRALKDMVRIGKKVVVVFDNNSYISRRLRFLWRGTYINPDTGDSDSPWYTRKNIKPWYTGKNIKPFSISDFDRLCSELQVQPRARKFFGIGGTWNNPKGWANVRAHSAMYLLEE